MNQDPHSENNLYMAMELSNKEWKLAFGDGHQERLVGIPARDRERLRSAIAKAKVKLGLPEAAPTFSCYEAGRDGFWIHRMLEQMGVKNLVVDSASIEVNRRKRRAKTDRLDAKKLLAMLLRYRLYGEQKTWSVVRVPSEADENRRRHHRNEERLKKERKQHLVRIKSLLALHGVAVKRPPADWGTVRDWAGRPLPAELVRELEQEQARLGIAQTQLKTLEQDRLQRLRAAKKDPAAPATERWAVKLASVKGVGADTAWRLSHEFFGWREFRNRREVGAAAGLTGSPYSSGDSQRDQGISKAGNKRVRHLMTELAWRWLKFQPHSALARWYEQRFGGGTKRTRRVGIVALARKLLIALWLYGGQGVVPAGVALKAA
jgi:transposase